MKISLILKILVFSAFGIILRVIFYNSKYKDLLKSLLIFDQSSYNFNNLKESYIYNKFLKISSLETNNNGFSKNNTQKILDKNYYSEYEFISKPLALTYKYIKKVPNNYIFIFYIVCDLVIAFLISTFKYKCSSEVEDNIIEENENQESEFFNLGVFCFYLCNPVSITTCVSFNLDVIFTLINLLLGYFSDNIVLCPFFAFVSIILSPGYIFITVIFFIYLLSTDISRYQMNIYVSLIFIILYFKFASKLGYFPFESLKNLYYNYYWFKDIRPNFGLLWVLLPSTFLKYQNYTLMMFLVYQLTLSLSVMLSVNRVQEKDYKYKKSLIYILIFYMSHILDRYPCENHLVVILCILLQHYEIIKFKVKIFDFGIYCAFASYTLIICRGFPYTHRRSGSSNYLFYQNLTYIISQIMIIMFSLTGINEFRKKKNEKEKEKEDKSGNNKKNKIEEDEHKIIGEEVKDDEDDNYVIEEETEEIKRKKEEEKEKEMKNENLKKKNKKNKKQKVE